MADSEEQIVAEAEASQEEHPQETPAPRRAPIEIWKPGHFEQPKLLVFGDSGVGKTVFASTAPAPLFADLENGMRSVTIEGVARWPVNSWLDLRIVVQWLIKRKHEYKTLVIDSLNEAMKMCIDNVLQEFTPGQSGVGKRTYNDLPNVSDYGKALDDFLHFIREIKSLPLVVILLATTSGAKSSTDRIEPALTGKNTVGNVARYMDVIGWLHVMEGESGNPTRVLSFDTPEALTKDRSGRLPATIFRPVYSDLAKFWKEK